MANKYTFGDLEKLLPGLTRYQITSARKHIMQHGRGAPKPPCMDTSMKVDPVKLDHFIAYITSAHVVQDPIRSMIPERIISQYQQYCAKSHFVPMGKRTLLRVLDACSGRAFDDLAGVVEKLAEQLGQGWGRKQSAILRASKRYLKGDYKCHHLRSVKQDEAWHVILDNLDDTSVLLILDWAMKFLPRKYRERQTDWFGKREIPWHITVAHWQGNTVETFIHLFHTCTQDNQSVASILEHTIQQLKNGLRNLTSIYIRSDNASCYHNTLSFQCTSVPPPVSQSGGWNSATHKNHQHSSQPSNPGCTFPPVKSKGSQVQQECTSDSSEEEDASHLTQDKGHGAIFPCPDESCIMAKLERETLLDKAKLMYAVKLEQGPTGVPYIEPSGANRTTSSPQQGWEFRGTKKYVRFTSKQKEYLDGRFHLGQLTGMKADPQTFSKDLRHARNAQGQRLFEVQEFLTTQQVASYFSRLAAKRRRVPEETDSRDPAELESIHSALQTQSGYAKGLSLFWNGLCLDNNKQMRGHPTPAAILSPHCRDCGWTSKGTGSSDRFTVFVATHVDIYSPLRRARNGRRLSKRSSPFRTVVAFPYGRRLFSERSSPFRTVVAFSQNGRRLSERSSSFLRSVVAFPNGRRLFSERPSPFRTVVAFPNCRRLSELSSPFLRTVVAFSKGRHLFSERSSPFLRTVVALLNGLRLYSERSSPFRTVVAFSQNGRRLSERSSSFLRSVVAFPNGRRLFLERSSPFRTAVAFPKGRHLFSERSSPFLRTVVAFPNGRRFFSELSSPFLRIIVSIPERLNLSSKYPRHVRDFPEFLECGIDTSRR
ncbi:hypothetical protein Bbelb_364410 [Branchiostoma belcheri]|nr:hypothetical protein Bbelb_364410 [Branchiostoma belcheri]